MTLKIMNSTSHAGPRCEPKKRDRRPSLRGFCISRITANTTSPASTATMNRSSRNPSHAWVPMSGRWKSRWNSAPKPSTIVAPRMTKPQKTAKCAAPGTVHFSSLRCPNTSVATVHSRVPTSAVRPGSAGCPARASR